MVASMSKFATPECVTCDAKSGFHTAQDSQGKIYCVKCDLSTHFLDGHICTPISAHLRVEGCKEHHRNFLGEITCNKCSKGHQFIANGCQPLPANCAIMNEKGCTECQAAFMVHNGGC